MQHIIVFSNLNMFETFKFGALPGYFLFHGIIKLKAVLKIDFDKFEFDPIK